MLLSVLVIAQTATAARFMSALEPQRRLNQEYPEDQCGYWYQTEGYEQYKAQRDNCEWSEPVSAKEYFPGSFYTGQSWDGRAVRETWTDPLHQEIFVQECWFEDQDPLRKGEFWTLRRFGPYYSDGAHDHKALWQQTKWNERFTKRFMTGRSFARYNAKTGELLGSPPIHVHHEHVAYTENLPDFVPLLSTFRVNRLAASHGEQYGLGENGVIFNVFKQLPMGLGKPMHFYTFDNKLADMRDDGAEPMEWFQEVGFRTTPAQRREVYHMTRFNIGSIFTNFNLELPQDSPALFWSTWRMPASGEFITNWIHTHGLEKVIIFKGDPKKFGLAGKYSKPDIWTMKKVDSVTDTAADLLAMAQQAGIEWCEGTPQFEEVDYPERAHHKETRITKVCCLPWKFKKGEVAAMVGLYDGRKPDVAGHQHFLFRGEYFLDEAEKQTMTESDKTDLLERNLQFCGENPDTCVADITLGLKLSAVLFYGGNLPEDTWFGQYVGWIMLGVIVLILAAVSGFSCRYALKRFKCWPYNDTKGIERAEYLPVSPSYSTLPEI